MPPKSHFSRTPSGPPPASSPRRAWSLVAAVFLAQAAAYWVLLFSMSFGYNRFAGLQLLKFQASIVANSLLAPTLLLLVLSLTGSRVYALLHHAVLLLTFQAFSLYYHYFNAIPHVNLLRQSDVLPSILPQIFRQLVGPREIAMAVLLLASLLASMPLARRQRPILRSGSVRTVAVALLVVLGAKGLWLHRQLPVEKYRYDGVYALKRNGLTPVIAHQIWSELRRERVDHPWPGKINRDNRREVTYSRGPKNVIVLQIESLDPWVLDHDIGGQPVTPRLRGFRSRSMYFDQFYPQHRGGGSSDAELSFFSGLLPLATHSGYITADFPAIRSLPRLLGEEGYRTAGLHANAGSYFYRFKAYSQLGFDRFHDRDDYHGEAAGWYAKDDVFLDQTYEILGTYEEPFFAYIITMQSHGPFTNHRSGDDAFAFGPDDSRLFRDYILTLHEVDAAVGAFLDRLEETGAMERTVVMIFGDHRSEVSPADLEEPADGWSHERIPCLIYSPDLEPGTSSKVGSHLDLGPTLLHLLGLGDVDRWLGTSLLDSGPGTAVLVQHGKSMVLSNGPEGGTVVALEAEPYWKYLDYSAGLLHP